MPRRGTCLLCLSAIARGELKTNNEKGKNPSKTDSYAHKEYLACVKLAENSYGAECAETRPPCISELIVSYRITHRSSVRGWPCTVSLKPSYAKSLLLSVALCLIICIAGCTPRVIVRQNPTADDQGIRYYRPKPYLLISSLAKDTTASPDFVSITLDYLPDFSEEYAIDVRPGLGIADVNIGLQDGWNLVSLNQKLDSQTDENIKATSDLLKTVAGFGAPASGAGQGTARPVIQVPAHNVPLGYYEAVIGKNRHGKKQLFGFRYVGFLPFQACPLDLCGSTSAVCDNCMLYGLTFDAGVMTFKPLCEMAAVPQPSEQMPGAAVGDITLTRNFSRSWSLKGKGAEEPNVTIQDTGSLPIAVPFSEINSRP